MDNITKKNAYSLIDCNPFQFGVMYHKSGGFSIVWQYCGTYLRTTIGTPTAFTTELTEPPELDAVYEWKHCYCNNKFEKLRSFYEDSKGDPKEFFNVIWEAPVEPEEITMSELITRLGYPVKIVEG